MGRLRCLNLRSLAATFQCYLKDRGRNCHDIPRSTGTGWQIFKPFYWAPPRTSSVHYPRIMYNVSGDACQLLRWPADSTAPPVIVLGLPEGTGCGSGGARWDRTIDHAVMSRALYRLSYGTEIGVGCGWLARSQPSLRLIESWWFAHCPRLMASPKHHSGPANSDSGARGRI